MNIKIAETDNEILSCYDTMSHLRPHIKKEEFLGLIKEHEEEGYKLAFVLDEDRVVTVAGFRFLNTLAWGKIMYVDDLVTGEDERSKGYGDKMIDWLIQLARGNKCQAFHLDSGVFRYAAHKFYFRKDLIISCYHFELDLEP